MGWAVWGVVERRMSRFQDSLAVHRSLKVTSGIVEHLRLYGKHLLLTK